jgi:hypothetical protein
MEGINWMTPLLSQLRLNQFQYNLFIAQISNQKPWCTPNFCPWLLLWLSLSSSLLQVEFMLVNCVYIPGSLQAPSMRWLATTRFFWHTFSCRSPREPVPLDCSGVICLAWWVPMHTYVYLCSISEFSSSILASDPFRQANVALIVEIRLPLLIVRVLSALLGEYPLLTHMYTFSRVSEFSSSTHSVGVIPPGKCCPDCGTLPPPLDCSKAKCIKWWVICTYLFICFLASESLILNFRFQFNLASGSSRQANAALIVELSSPSPQFKPGGLILSVGHWEHNLKQDRL